MADVARVAGVSKTTVSLVLSDAETRLAEETRRRVRSVASQLGYRRDLIASSMRTTRTDTIGLLSDRIATTPFGWAMVAGAQEAARERGRMLLVANTEGDPDREVEAVRALRDRRVDGLVLGSLFHRPLDATVVDVAVPVVLLDAYDPVEQVPSIVPDDESGGHDATAALLAAGHRRVAFINTSTDISARSLRLSGHRRALANAGIDWDPDLYVEVDESLSPAGGLAATLDLLDRPEPPTGIFAFNDRVASGVYQAVRRRGLSIPDDVSVVGFDNEEGLALAMEPPLTTVALPHREMGAWAVNRLLDMVDGVEPETRGRVRREPCPLVVRDSVGPPPT